MLIKYIFKTQAIIFLKESFENNSAEQLDRKKLKRNIIVMFRVPIGINNVFKCV